MAHQANGMGGVPIVGDPDDVAEELARLSPAGARGTAVSFVNFLEELPLFCDAVLPQLMRLELRCANNRPGRDVTEGDRAGFRSAGGRIRINPGIEHRHVRPGKIGAVACDHGHGVQQRGCRDDKVRLRKGVPGAPTVLDQ